VGVHAPARKLIVVFEQVVHSCDCLNQRSGGCTSELMTRFICGRKTPGPGLLTLYRPFHFGRCRPAGKRHLARDVSDSIEHFLVAQSGCFRLSNELGFETGLPPVLVRRRRFRGG
jgi:hypothetical protein